MNLIPYEEFSIDRNTLNKLNEHYVNRKINEYFTQHGQLPDSGAVETYSIPPELMDRYKRYYYSEYYKKVCELEKEYGPGENVETRFSFSTNEDSGDEILGSSLRLGEGVGNNEEEYQYEYWNIVVIGGYKYDLGISPTFRKIGSFTSLENATITLYSLTEYQIYVYLRKSNSQYDRTIAAIPLDNQFHDFNSGQIIGNTKISDYSTPSNYYTTENEDKEYIGVVNSYVPKRGGVISGNIYTLNPRIQLNVSGLTDGATYKLMYGTPITVLRDSGGSITIVDNNSVNLVQTSDSSFSCLLQKNVIARSVGVYASTTNNIYIHSLFDEFYYPNNRIEDINSIYGQTGSIHCFVDGQIKDSAGFSFIPRNNIITLDVVLPELGVNVDTGFDFDTIDD